MAFERVSNVLIKPFEEETQYIDIRKVRLPFEKPPVGNFDPRDYRQSKQIIQPWMAYFNLLKISIGPGMLGMPLAVSQAGIIVGPIMMVVVGLLVCHMHLSLLWCLNEMSRQLKIPYLSYRYGFRIALLHGPPIVHFLGRCGPWIIATFMILSQLGICTIMVLLNADSVRDIMDWDSSYPALMCLFVPYILLETLMKNFSRVSYVAMAGNVMNTIGMLLVTYTFINDPHQDDIPTTYVATTTVPYFLAFGTILYNISAIAVTLACDKALKNPRIMTKTCGAIRVGTLVPTCVACAFGVYGYVSLGNMEENVLRSLPLVSSVTTVTFSVYLLAVGMSYPLSCYPGVNIAMEVIRNHDPNVEPSNACLNTTDFIGRQIFVVVTFVIAYYIPFQATLVAFVGNLCNTLLVLVFPALMEMCILYPNNYGRFNYLLLKDLLIAILGFVTWISGIWLCLTHFHILLLSLESPNNAIFK